VVVYTPETGAAKQAAASVRPAIAIVREVTVRFMGVLSFESSGWGATK
jgi:hypothetical protein